MRLFPSILVLILLGGCCTKKKCAVASRPIELRNYSLGELDTIKMVYMDRPADTVYTEGAYTSDSSFLTIAEVYELDESVTVIVPSANKEYVLTDFTYAKKEIDCNNCLFRKDYYDAFVGCKVNGEQQTGDIVLSK